MNRRSKRLISLLLLSMMITVVLMGCGNRTVDLEGSSQETEPDNLNDNQTESDKEKEETAEAVLSTEIQLNFGGTTVTAVLDNSETTQAFMDRLPLTISMNRYDDREYYAAIPELPENGEEIPDFENGDITYYTSGKSLAVFFGNADSSSQGDLIRMGHITSDLTVFDDMADSLEVTISLAKVQR